MVSGLWVYCQRDNWAKKRGYLGGTFIIPRNVGKNSQILHNPLKFAFLNIFRCKQDPIFGQWRYDPVFTTRWFEIGWSYVQLFVFCLRGPNRWASFNMISSLKGLLVLWFAFQIAFKAAADLGIGFYAPVFIRTSLFFAARFTLRWHVRFLTQNQGFKCYLYLCKLNFMQWLIKELLVVGVTPFKIDQNKNQNRSID